MTDEPAFLAAVAERPGDSLPRLVYADWLDDRGDPRAELIRIEEEQRTLPADADRYWALKPRRDELRAGCSADWLAAMGYGTVYRPVLSPWPTADVKGRFRLLRELVERWYGVTMPDAGGRADEVAAVEARLGRALPVAVREWIAFDLDVRDRPPARRFLQDMVVRDEVDYHADLAAVSLPRHGGTGELWAVQVVELGAADPPVSLYYRGYEDEDDQVGRFVLDRRIDAVSTLGVTHFLDCIHFGPNGFRLSAQLDWTNRREMSEFLGPPAPVAGREVYEQREMIVQHIGTEDGEYSHLCFHFRRPISPEAIPMFVRRMSGRTDFGGVFTPDGT